LSPVKNKGPSFKLNLQEQQSLLIEFDKRPGLTNSQAAALVAHRINHRTVSDYLTRCGYSRKLFSDEQEKYGSEDAIQLVKEYCATVREIPPSCRVYVDESFVYDNEAPKRGRAQRGQPIPRVRSRHGKRWTVYAAIREDGFVHPPIIDSQTADDLKFYHYVWRYLVPNLRPNEVVIWDRLGKSGRCKNPSKQHYNPGAQRLIEEKKCRILFLPPKGKLFNPIELVFGTLKTHLRNRYTTSVACLEQRARTESELEADLEYATSQIGRMQFEGFFRERGTERAFRSLYPHIAVINHVAEF
jgi:transposase